MKIACFCDDSGMLSRLRRTPNPVGRPIRPRQRRCAEDLGCWSVLRRWKLRPDASKNSKKHVFRVFSSFGAISRVKLISRPRARLIRGSRFRCCIDRRRIRQMPGVSILVLRVIELCRLPGVGGVGGILQCTRRGSRGRLGSIFRC